MIGKYKSDGNIYSVPETNEKLANIEGADIGEISETVKSLENDNTTNKTDISNIKANLLSVNTLLQAHASELSDIDSEISDINLELSSIDSDISALQTASSNNTNNISTLTQTLNTLSSKVSDNDTILKRTVTELNNLRNDIFFEGTENITFLFVADGYTVNSNNVYASITSLPKILKDNVTYNFSVNSLTGFRVRGVSGIMQSDNTLPSNFSIGRSVNHRNQLIITLTDVTTNYVANTPVSLVGTMNLTITESEV